MLTDRAVAVCRFAPDAQLLDVGCGVGASVEHLRSSYGFKATGVDISTTLIKEGLKRSPDLPLYEAAAEALPVARDSQDGILCECVLSLLDDPGSVLQEFRRVLRSGGCLILSDMYSRESAGPDDGSRGMVTRNQIEAWFSASGFTTVLWEDHTPLLRELAARLILAGDLLDRFDCSSFNAGQRPGYYLLVARKE